MSGIENSSATHSIKLRTTAEPSPTEAMVKPAAVGATPASVNSRYPRVPPAAEPPGTTLVTDLVASWMRKIVNTDSRGSLGSVTLVSTV